MNGFAVGQVIGVPPPEPPIGTVIECRDSDGAFDITRDEFGWKIVGSPLVSFMQWGLVVERYLPGTIILLPSSA